MFSPPPTVADMRRHVLSIVFQRKAETLSSVDLQSPSVSIYSVSLRFGLSPNKDMREER
jgi:hypothetical protein